MNNDHVDKGLLLFLNYIFAVSLDFFSLIAVNVEVVLVVALILLASFNFLSWSIS